MKTVGSEIMSSRGIWKAGLLSAAVLCSVTAVIAATSSRSFSNNIDVVDVTAPESVAEILAFDPFKGSILPEAPAPEEAEAVAGDTLNTAVALFNEGQMEVEGAMEVAFDPMNESPLGVENKLMAVAKKAEETTPGELPATIFKSSEEDDGDALGAWQLAIPAVVVGGVVAAGSSLNNKDRGDGDRPVISPSTP